MSTKLNAQIVALIEAGKTNQEIVAETGEKMGIVKATRMNVDADKQIAAQEAAKTAAKPAAKPEALVAKPMSKMAEMAAKAKAKKDAADAAKVEPTTTTDGADIVAPAAKPKATRTKVVKDLTKRDVVAIVSDSAKIVYVCTSLKYSGVGLERAKTLLCKDLVARANQKPKNEQGIRDLLAADDMTCLLTLVGGEASEAQVNKLKTHMAYEANGYQMLSTKGRGAEVKAALAKIATEAAEAPVTVTA